MNKIIIISLSTILTSICFGQINLDESTFSAVAYWTNHESHTYKVVNQKYVIQGTDTSNWDITQHEIDILVTDSTSTSYTLSCKYNNFLSNGDNEFTKRLKSFRSGLTIIVKTNEMGGLIEVVNWQDVSNYINKSLALFQKDFKDNPNTNTVIDQVKEITSTKEKIESDMIKDIEQLFTFNGGQYHLNKVVNTKQKMDDMYGGDPLDADVVIELFSMNEENNSAVIKYNRVADKEQTKTAAFNYHKKEAIANKTEVPKMSEIPTINLEYRTASAMHGTGWTLSSVEVKEIISEGFTNIERENRIN